MPAFKNAAAIVRGLFRAEASTVRSPLGERTAPAACRATLLFVLLAMHSCAAVDDGRPAQTSALSYSGSSFNTSKPAPSTFKLLADMNFTMYGRDVLNSTALESAHAAAQAVLSNTFGSQIITQWTHYTAHPSQTPGLENYTALTQHSRIMGGSDVPKSVLVSLATVDGFSLLKAQVARSLASMGVTIHLFMDYLRIDYFPGVQLNGESGLVTSEFNGITQILSRLQLRGHNLLPFHFDKQALLIETIVSLLPADGILGFHNVSDWRIAESATNISRRLLSEPVDTLHVEVWTTMYPWVGVTAPQLWSNISAPDPRCWEATKKWGVPMNLTFVNATAYSWPKGAQSATVVITKSGSTDLVAETTGIPTTASKSSGFGPGGIAGIVVGSAALLLALAVLGSLLLRRKRRHAELDSSIDCQGQIDPDEIEICKRPDGTEWLLGEGSFGKVFKALRRGTTVVAIKQMKYSADEELLHQMKKEAAVLQRVANDPHVVQFYGACTCNPPMLCMEFMEGGDLYSTLQREVRLGTHEFDWYHRGKEVALAVARGIHFLHTSGVTHRDVKSNNILLTKHGDAKVADVGLASMSGYSSVTSDVFGNFAYAAPEVLMGSMCTSKMDVYSYGILLWAIVTKEIPNRGHMRVVRVPEECPSEVESLIQCCMNWDMEKRPTMKEIVERLEGVAD